MPMKIIINVAEKQHNFLLLCEDICQTIAEVKQFCYCRFPQLQNGAELRIFWNDQDGDEICVVTDDDYKSFMLAAGKDKRRLYVEAKEAMQVDASVCPVQNAPAAETAARRPVHQDIICDVCDRDIVGHRYRCLTCYDYDLCMTCESKYRHKDHVMLRIPQPLRSRTLSHRVLERMERYAAKLDLIPADGDVDGKKFATVEVDYSTDKIRDKARRDRREMVRAARDHNNAEGKPTQPCLKAGSSTRSREQTKRCKAVKVVSDSVKEQKRAKTGEVANEKVKERAPVPLPWVNDVAGQSTFCRRTHVHRPSCPYSIKPEAASSLPVESLHCSGKSAKHANQPGLTSATKKSCNIFTGNIPEPSLQENAANVTSPTGSMVSVLVDGVLKHTPPEFKKFLPTDEEMNRVSEKISTLLGHLGLELKMPPTENEAASTSTGSTVAQAGSTVAEEAKEESEVSVAAADDEKDESEAIVAGKKKDTVAQGSKTALDTDSGPVGASLAGEKVQGQQQGPAVDNDECSADTSSASMLTDDEVDDLEAEQVSKQSNSTAAQEIPWILVDLPEEEVKQKEENNSPITSSSTPVGSVIPPASPDKEQSMEIEESEGEPEDLDEHSQIRNLIEYTKTRLAMLQKNALKEGKVDERVKVVFEKLYQDLEKLKLDQTTEKRNDQMEQQNNGGDSVSESKNAKKILPEASTSPSASSFTTPVPPVRTSSVPQSSNEAVSAAPRPQTDAPFRKYSRRPHVNHAIHTMMTMGFNNNDGRLTHLLEVLNGDIPRALDKLMQKVP